MQITIWRKYRKDGYTIGRMYIDGKFFCNTLEDKDRGLMQGMSVGEVARLKVKKETAIPVGNYRVLSTFSPRFKKNMPQIMNVKGFTGVRIHAGNTDEDTEGCVLLGDNKLKGRLVNSRMRVKEFMKVLAEAGDMADLKIVWDYEEGVQ